MSNKSCAVILPLYPDNEWNATIQFKTNAFVTAIEFYPRIIAFECFYKSVRIAQEKTVSKFLYFFQSNFLKYELEFLSMGVIPEFPYYYPQNAIFADTVMNNFQKMSKYLSKPEKKFSADMTYGMLAAQSCLLTDIVDQLHENSKKVNSVERLTRHLNKGIPAPASKNDIYLVLVYGITEYPMMLATNKELKSKEDVISVALTYFSRWRIEEYFRSKKQLLRFENFRVRKLRAISALIFILSYVWLFWHICQENRKQMH